MLRPLAVLAALSFGCAIASCDGSEASLTWSIEFANRTLKGRAALLETRIVRGGCAGTELIHEGELTPSATPSYAGRLTPGRYGFSASARDASCVRFAAGCLEVDVPEHSAGIVVTLEEIAEQPACAASACMVGRCAPGSEAPDGGATPMGDAGSEPLCIGPTCEDLIDVVAGAGHSCARRRSGEVLCWGHNDEAQLGDGTTIDRLAPVVVAGLEAAKAISAGGSHTCAIVGDGEIVCWGSNSAGQLGDGTTTQRSSPTRVVDLPEPATAVDCGGYHTCALLASGAVACWGWNVAGQLGTGDTDDRRSPAPVVGLDDAIQISVNEPVCALKRTGRVVCWGDNTDGAIGDGTMGGTRLAPGVPVVGVTGAVEVAAGGGFACARDEAGAVSCWGDDGVGQLGDGDASAPRPTPAVLGGLTDAKRIDAGHASACALRTGGAIACWGWNGEGELGDGTTDLRAAPGAVVGIESATGLGATIYHHACAIVAADEIRCWGQNDFGQIGDGAAGTNRATPTRVRGLVEP